MLHSADIERRERRGGGGGGRGWWEGRCGGERSGGGGGGGGRERGVERARRVERRRRRCESAARRLLASVLSHLLSSLLPIDLRRQAAHVLGGLGGLRHWVCVWKRERERSEELLATERKREKACASLHGRGAWRAGAGLASRGLHRGCVERGSAQRRAEETNAEVFFLARRTSRVKPSLSLPQKQTLKNRPPPPPPPPFNQRWPPSPGPGPAGGAPGRTRPRRPG